MGRIWCCRYKEAVAQRRLWTPALLPSVTMWLDAADRSTITVATGVSQWRDKSGNGRHATQATGSAQPVLTADAQTPAIQFANLQYFDIPTFAYNGVGSVFGALRVTNASVSQSLLQTDAAGTDYIYWSGDSLTYPQIFRSARLTSLAGDFRNTNRQIFEIVSNQPASRYELINTGIVKHTSTSAFTAASDPNRIGSGQQLMGTYVYEIVVTRTALSAQDRAKVEGYLAWKSGGFNLPAYHPYKSRPPLIGD